LTAASAASDWVAGVVFGELLSPGLKAPAAAQTGAATSPPVAQATALVRRAAPNSAAPPPAPSTPPCAAPLMGFSRWGPRAAAIADAPAARSSCAMNGLGAAAAAPSAKGTGRAAVPDTSPAPDGWRAWISTPLLLLPVPATAAALTLSRCVLQGARFRILVGCACGPLCAGGLRALERDATGPPSRAAAADCLVPGGGEREVAAGAPPTPRS
jgi:hypothetical protein